MPTPTEIHFYPNPAGASGTFVAEVKDNAGVPANVIEASEQFTVDCDWDIDAVTAALLGGIWHVDLFAESIGPGFEGKLGSNLTAVVPGQTSYSLTITVPGGTLPNDPDPHGAESQVFKLAVVLRHHNGPVTTSIAALQEGPVVMVR
jgi:hypothetical protein